jgi:hypothetical protein
MWKLRYARATSGFLTLNQKPFAGSFRHYIHLYFQVEGLSLPALPAKGLYGRSIKLPATTEFSREFSNN